MRERVSQTAHSGLLAALVAAGLLSACAAGPDYKRPDLELPQGWTTPQAATATAQSADTQSERWWGLYADPVLDRLEQEALAHNADLQVALARVMGVRAQLGNTEADQYPTVSGNLSGSRTKNTMIGSFPRPATLPRTMNFYHATLNASYELDLWGRFRRASEAARADLLASEAARDGVRLSLTAQVAQQYFALLALDAQESALKRALAGREETLALDRKRVAVGVLSEYNLQQSVADAAAVRSQMANLTQARDRQETALALLLGRSPRAVMGAELERGIPGQTDDFVPTGLPSELLLRRPDLRQAEQNLIAQNARIGVARAQYFPSIGLTTYVGGESISFARLFSGPAGIFQFAANVTQPIFNAGRVGHAVDAATASRDRALAQYKQAVANAFGDVRDALAAQAAARQVLEAETTRAEALEQAHRQSRLRYEHGIANRLELLDVERSYLQAELNRLDAQRAQRSAVADLFKALGGGWRSDAGERTAQP